MAKVSERRRTLGMPLLGEPEMSPIPWGIIEPHEEQALKNHYQTLTRLAERGGLSVCEAVAVIEDRPWHAMASIDAIMRLSALVRTATDKLKEEEHGKA